MVKLGFIVEGYSEKIVVESATFQAWVARNGMTVIRPVINAKGGGNLLPQNIEPMVATLQPFQPDHIMSVTCLPRPDEINELRRAICAGIHKTA